MCHRRGYVAAGDANFSLSMRSLRGEMVMVMLCALLFGAFIKPDFLAQECLLEALWKYVLIGEFRDFTFFYLSNKEAGLVGNTCPTKKSDPTCQPS